MNTPELARLWRLREATDNAIAYLHNDGPLVPGGDTLNPHYDFAVGDFLVRDLSIPHDLYQFPSQPLRRP